MRWVRIACCDKEGDGPNLGILMLSSVDVGSLMDLTCESCGVVQRLSPPEVEALVTALRAGDMERLQCPTCGMGLSGSLQRALNLHTPETPRPAAPSWRRQHVRLAFDLPVTYQQPDAEEATGLVKGLSDGGLLLLAREVLRPSTPVRLQLHTGQGTLAFEGVVVWNDAGRGPSQSSIAHGIRFTSSVTAGLAVELFLAEAVRRRE